jgi:phosphomannomutase
MSHQFNRTILREYDIRGVVGSTLNPDDAYALGRSYAALAVSEGAKRIAVGRDGRTHSPELEEALVRGLNEGGLTWVRDRHELVADALFRGGNARLDGGIQVTGSHNPADYNGFKMLLNGRSVFGVEIQELGRRAAKGDWSEGQGKIEEIDIVDAYVDALVKGFDGKAYRIGWDAGMGRPAHREKLVKRLPGRALHPLSRKSTADFPTIIPTRPLRANLVDLKKLVADRALISASHSMATPTGSARSTPRGRVIWGDQLLIILAEEVLKDEPGATIIADVKASQTLFDRIAEMGGIH